MIDKLNVDITGINTPIKNHDKDKLIRMIDTEKTQSYKALKALYKDRDLSSRGKDDLIRLMYWSSQGRDDICEFLQTWFKENNLMIQN
jgi:hypothetical protein